MLSTSNLLFSSINILFSHSTVERLHICEELDYQLWVLQAELWRRVRRPHDKRLGGGLGKRLLRLKGLRVDFFNQIKLLLVQNYLLDSYRLTTLRLAAD